MGKKMKLFKMCENIVNICIDVPHQLLSNLFCCVSKPFYHQPKSLSLSHAVIYLMGVSRRFSFCYSYRDIYLKNLLLTDVLLFKFHIV